MQRTWIAWLLVCGLGALAPSEIASAMCDVIPGVTQSYRGAQGSLNRPFALPNDDGEILEFSLLRDPSDPLACDTGSVGFSTDPETKPVVTVVFTPPQGPANAVVLASDCEALAPDLAACQTDLGGGIATCRDFDGAGDLPGGLLASDLVVESADRLRFRFPDTDALLDAADDDHTYTGPVTIAVTEAGAPLACELATTRCADTPGLLACIDELYARDGSCENTAAHIDPVFGHFTALPPANDYQALCTSLDTPCTGLQDEVRFTVDASGNALIPMDYQGILIQSNQIPIPRLILGNTGIEAFAGSGEAVDLPSDAFVSSFAPGGQRLPPIFTPIANPDAEGDLSLFGSVDAPVGVIRVQRRACVGGANEGATCTRDAECGEGGSCPAQFDFTDRLTSGVGPVLIANSDFSIEAQNPVPLDGLIESESMFAFVANEAIEDEHLNDDSDTTDPVIRIRDRMTGRVLPIGTGGAAGRAATRVSEGRFRFPAVAVEDNVVAFLELEPLEGDCEDRSRCDTNGNGSVFDPILRVFQLTRDASGIPRSEDLTASLSRPIAVDAAPLVNGRSVAISQGLVYARVPEWRNARQVTERVNIASDGTQGNFRSSSPVLSDDGQSVAFSSNANNLAPGDDSGNVPDVFVHDRITGETERVSLLSEVPRGLPNFLDLSLSGDGQFVAFDSFNGDVFVYDRSTGVTQLVSTTPEGIPGNGVSGNPSFSGDGLSVGFFSEADDLVPDDANGFADAFVYDRASGHTERVNLDSEARQGNAAAGGISMSQDGGIVAFSSDANNLVPGDTNSMQDAFVHDRATRITERVSVASDGSQGTVFWLGSPGFTALSRDGRIVGFNSIADNFVAGDTNSTTDVFVRDRSTGTTERVSIASDGTQGNEGSSAKTGGLSADGRLAVFTSAASDLVPGDTNGSNDLRLGIDAFLHDRTTGATERVSVASDGTQAVGTPLDFSAVTSGAVLSADGRTVAFASWADNLVPNDTNGTRDIFVRGPDRGDFEADLSGDGSLDDVVLEVIDITRSPVDRRTLLPAAEVAVVAGTAAFLVPGEDGVGHVHLSVRGQPAADLALEAIDIALSPQLLVARIPAADGGEAWGEICDWPTQRDCWISLDSRALAIDARGSVVALLAPECPYDDASGLACPGGGQDLNGDGDTGDRVIRIFRFEDGRLSHVAAGRSTHERIAGEAPRVADFAAEEFVLGERLLAFRSRESSQREDLNGDGDLDDTVLLVVDLVTERVFNTQTAATPCPLEACDPRLPYRVQGDTVVYVTAEPEQGAEDLNGDGDASDLVKQVFNAREAALGAPPDGAAGACVDTIAAASAGICTSTGAACAVDTDCGSGKCYLPPGACIADLGSTCTCVGGGCFGCADKEFCVPLPGGDGQAGTCHEDQGACATQSDCASPAVCTDAAADVQRIFSPIAAVGRAGDQAVFSAGRCIRACGTDEPCSPSGSERRGSCRKTDDCEEGFACSALLIVAGAADSDRDDLADPYDNCPSVENADQADRDGDGIGDVCDAMTCGNAIVEPGEQCDDGNEDATDGCNTMCRTPVGELLAFFDTEVMEGTLVGAGSGHSATGRLGSLRHQLASAVKPGTAPAACGALKSALARTDGARNPPDFVGGSGAPALAEAIAETQSELGCEARPRRVRGASVGLGALVLVAAALRLRPHTRRHFSAPRDVSCG